MNPFVIFLIIFTPLCLVLFFAVYVPIKSVIDKYNKFVSDHSEAIRNLREINKKYKFKDIPKFDMTHSYDNENFYNDISPQDYLTYELVYKQHNVKDAISDSNDNKELFTKYDREIYEKCVMDQYDTTELLKNRERLIKYEKKMFDKERLKPVVYFTIKVTLNLTNIQDHFITCKSATFNTDQIIEIMHKLQQKRGSFYTNDDIWQAICRVERGKVTNKIRFMVYDRDHNRCRKCGSPYNLEVDHIFPIAKGGKSTINNLQTLCHRCNAKKGANIE